MGHTEVYWGADVFTFAIFFYCTLSWIYLMCACSNPIWGLFRSIAPSSSLMKWWDLPLGCWWSGDHFLHQHNSWQSHPRQERNQLGRIYVSRGLGYDSLHNIHVAKVCLVGISLLIYLLGGGLKCNSVFQDRRNHSYHGIGDYIAVGYDQGNPLTSFSCTHTCPLVRKYKRFWYWCTYTFFRPSWVRCSTGFWTLLNRMHLYWRRLGKLICFHPRWVGNCLGPPFVVGNWPPVFQMWQLYQLGYL